MNTKNTLWSAGLCHAAADGDAGECAERCAFVSEEDQAVGVTAASPSRSVSRSRSSDPQFDPIVRRMHQVLFGSQIPLGRLNRRVSQQQLNLLKLAACSAAHLRATPVQVMRRDSGHSRRRSVRPK